VFGLVEVNASGLLLLVDVIHRQDELDHLGIAAVNRNRLTILGRCVILSNS
jgi:hypothetical protein